ncbi:hypothetical protein BDV26DRAFT_293330 [Aspergillus bertholletiae]|uniref:CBF1-interacting co-repressor CIR N-terminal domain-containing protein n=1 Tax=Aspergillus bertholletiae TaxID=1226010 RepID=A0A5N7B561_9EURO|nr:hypothetical protein BDV26DRAFT_293330 [Aspergillus bertholletiae]
MPLSSWNVYNPENIARVRRDEAQAQAREEEQERRMQEVDAERRIQILRGERPSTPPPPPRSPSPVSRHDKTNHAEDTARSRKRRRLAGENDTDRDIRFAREDAQIALAKREEFTATRSSDAPLYDSAGHIDLFPSQQPPDKRTEKNPDAEKESAERQKAYEDQYTMRFSNAAGFRQSVSQKPWYSSSGTEAMAPDSISGKDVWGNEDPLRREREKARVDANDPLAAMKKGVRQLKSVEQERRKWDEERRREMEVLKQEEKRRSRHRRRRTGIEEHTVIIAMAVTRAQIARVREILTQMDILVIAIVITVLIAAIVGVTISDAHIEKHTMRDNYEN